MKRSEIDRLIDEAVVFFDKHKLHLPPWARWSAEKWKGVGNEADEVRRHGMGWNVTDFGKGNFEKIGLLLCVIRNGCLDKGKPLTTKTYAEKAFMVKPGQVTPWHFHWHKTEDLINRGGGRLKVELGWAAEDEKGLSDKQVLVQVDGITRQLKPGESFFLEPGESVSLPPMLCHQFSGHPGDESVCAGEVSSLNDDCTDNCFIHGIGQRVIEEDAAARYQLIS